ncbi:sulfatase family protein [Urechidicola vernalis]|uniref:Arylsulfatase n=1 Tax=Urechidicola vernalis TaxID=3075600 RepID=A0ABU2Y7Q4_9FLAO|nr:arylsulfatase [Urechidicola sp. P050]MDT0553063.1 arylsulfatase [Urechidicola sp. P050]
MSIKKIFVFGFISLLVLSCKKESTSEKLPNIIYILTDDLGYGDISAFNPNGKIETPHIDNLAKAGMKFTDAHTSSAVCTPTRYGILTGRYNWRSQLKNGVLTGTSKALIPNSRTTIASLLKNKNYNTAYIGKWHLGWDWAKKDQDSTLGTGWNATDYKNIDFSKPITNGPKDLGFDYSFGHSGSLDMAPYVYVENGLPTSVPTKITVDKGKYTWWREGPTGDDFIHDDVTPNFFRKSISYIKDKAKDDNPFFLYLPLPSPHTPILPTVKWQGKSNLNPYADFVVMIDHYIGQLTSTLEELGIQENTLIVFTSDNGCSPQADFMILKEKGHNPSAIYRGHKADIYEGGHRVPFIVKWPLKVKPNTVSENTICTTDFFATVADIANINLEDSEGEDSYSMLKSMSIPSNNTEERTSTIHHSINGSFAIRKGDYKLILCPDSGGWSFPRPNNKKALEGLPKVQLYNLKNDPGEQYNIANDNEKMVSDLTADLNEIIENGRSTKGTKQLNDTGNHWKELWWKEKTLN